MKGGTQTIRLLELLKDRRIHGTDEIQEKVYGRSHLGSARIAARIHDLRKRYKILGTWIEPPIYGYRLVRKLKETV